MAEQNLIEIVIKSVDQMSGDLAKLQGEMGKLKGATVQMSGAANVAGSSLESLNTAATTLGVAFQPLNQQVLLARRAFELIKAHAPLAAILSLTTAVFAASKHFSDLGVEMGKLQRQTGFSTETLSGLKVVAESNEVSFGELTTGIRFFNRTLGQAVLGSQESIDLLDKLGVTAEEAKNGMADPEDVFEKAAQGYVKLGSIAEKTAIQMRIFGRGGRDVNLVLEDIAKKGLQGAREQAAALGVLWSGQMVESARKFNDAITSISQRLSGLAILLGSNVLPSVQKFLDYLLRLANIKFDTVSITLERMVTLSKELEAIDERLETRKSLRTKGLGFLTAPEEDDLKQLKRRLELTNELADAGAALGKIEADKNKKDTKNEVELAKEHLRLLDKFKQGLSRSFEDEMIKLDFQEPFLSTKMQETQIDRLIDDFVENFNRTAAVKITKDEFKDFRSDMAVVLFEIESDKLREIVGKNINAVAEAMQSGIQSDTQLGRFVTRGIEGLVDIDDEARREQVIRTRALQTASEKVGMIDDERVENLNRQLSLLRLEEAPLNRMLSILQQLDDLDKERLATTIKQKQELLDVKQILIDTDRATAEDTAAAEKLKLDIDILRSRQGTAIPRSLSEIINAQKEAESMASSLAGQFTDRFIALMEGEKIRLQDFFANLGRTIVSQFLQAMLAKLIVSPIFDMLSNLGGSQQRGFQQFGVGGALAGGIFSLFSKLFGGFSSMGMGGMGGVGDFDLPGFRKGGLVLAGHGASIPKFASGGVVRGPTLALLGEGGEDEFVIPRSKLAKNKNQGSVPTVIINGDIIPRRPEMRPEDVIRIVVNDGTRGGNSGVSNMVANIIKRNR